MIGVYAKKARGLLSRYIIENQIENVEDIKEFAVPGEKVKVVEVAQLCHKIWVQRNNNMQ